MGYKQLALTPDSCHEEVGSYGMAVSPVLPEVFFHKGIVEGRLAWLHIADKASNDIVNTTTADTTEQ